ncbi:PE-PPE domain-containing protein [Streptomyces sp. NBC_01356]|uniref:cutinase family protein n=1 Tax=Streptomyces sp. NBC_01356 TaxID=2903836 RepID=UPI002E328170|nr:cutinase family protein [Streptomyces sp. NBC_01356]
MVFIGAHGLNEDWKSTTIEKTWKSFYSAPRRNAPNPKMTSLLYPKMTVSQFFRNEVVGSQAVSATTVGVGFLNKEIKSAQANCSSTRFVLAGYSEGAWIIDRYLRQNHDYNLRSVVAGVLLYGDPQADNGSKEQGLARRYGYGVSGPYVPSELSDRFKTFCYDHDPICGKGFEGRSAEEQMSAAIACSDANCPHFWYKTRGAAEQGGRFLASKAFAEGPIDWQNRSYGLTCDDIVDKPVKVAVRNGKGDAKGSDLGGYDHWEVALQKTASGRLPRLGNVTAVLFYCSPQPSNFSNQELRVYREDGDEVGRTPSFNVSGLPPEYQAESLGIRDGRLTADVKFYGPEDSHATGPSIPRHVTWTWDGKRFVTHGAEPEAEAPERVDLAHQAITVNGIGPVELGMSRAQAEQAVEAPVPEGPGGPDCTDLSVKGGPDGLLLRFAQDNLVAVYVLSSASTSIATASGIHLGSTRADVLRTYANEVTVGEDPDELIFEPSGSDFEGKVIKFHTTNGQVDSFIAGQREWAELLPCGSD